MRAKKCRSKFSETWSINSMAKLGSIEHEESNLISLIKRTIYGRKKEG